MNYFLRLTILFLAAMLCISIFYVEINHYNQSKVLKKSLSQYDTNLEDFKLINNLIFGLQRERGMTTGLKGDDDYFSRLTIYLEQTNEYLRSMKLSASSQKTIELASKIEKDVKILRQENQLANQSKENIFIGYTVLVDMLLKHVRLTQAEQSFINQLNKEQGLQKKDIYSLLRAIELGGKLRAKLSRFITSEEPKVKTEALRHAFKLYSQHKNLLDKALGNESLKPYSTDKKQYIDQLFLSLTQGKGNFESKFKWWDLSTSYLDELIHHSYSIVEVMLENTEFLIERYEESTREALIKSIISGIGFFFSICLIIKLMSSIKTEKLSHQAASTLQLIIVFTSIVSTLFVEHFASQKQLRYLSQLESLRQLNFQVVENIDNFRQLWRDPKIEILIKSLSVSEGSNYLEMIQMTLDKPLSTKFLSRANLKSIIQIEKSRLLEGGIVTKAIETPHYGVIYIMMGLRVNRGGLSDELYVFETSLSHLVAKSNEHAFEMGNSAGLGYFAIDDLPYFNDLATSSESNISDKIKLSGMNAFIWDYELNLGAFVFEDPRDKTELLSTIENKFVWQILTLLCLFLIGLFVSYKSKEKHRKQELLASDNINTRQLFMNSSEQLASIGSFELNIEKKVLNTSEGFRKLFQLPIKKEFFKAKILLRLLEKNERKKIYQAIRKLAVIDTSQLDITLNSTNLRHFSLVLNIKYNHSTATNSIIGVVKEITNQVNEEQKQKRIQNELDAARKEAVIKMSEAEEERKAAQKLLAIKRSTEKLLQEAINSFPASIILLDHNQKVAIKNLFPDPLNQNEQDCFTFMGVEIKTGESIFSLISTLPLAHKSELVEMLNISTQIELYCEHIKCRYETPHAELWFEILVKNIKTDSEKYTLIYQTNITSDMNFSDELNAAKVKAEQANEAKSRFLATMSHEIRTPMNGVIGMLDMLFQSKLDPEQTHLTHVAKSSAQILLRIINDILDFSKIESGKMELETVPFDWLEIVKELAELLSYQASSKHLKLAFYFSKDLASKQIGDPIRLRQILLNLAGNALKFTKTTATQSGVVEITFTLSKEPNTYCICVKDNGKGMTSKQVDKLFNPFEQADNSVQRKYGGTGLGLSITGKLVEMMKGRIECQSLEGVGTSFSVHLPLSVNVKENCEELNFAHLKIAVVGDEDKFELDIANHLQLRNAYCEIIPKELFNAQLIDGQKFDYLIITAESFQQFTTEGRVVFVDNSSCHYIVLDNNLDKLPKAADISISNISLHPYYALKVVEHIAKLENLIESDTVEEVLSNSGTLPSIEEAQANRQLILVVEDNVYNQDLFKRQLAMLGFQCVVADNGKVALQLLEQFDFSLIITDCHMPLMDGYEFTRKRRKMESQNNLSYLPIIAATANALDGEKEKCLAVGMDDYLAKPIVLQALSKKVNSLLDRKQKNNQQDTLGKMSSFEKYDTEKPKYFSFEVLEEYVGDDKEIQLMFLESFVRDTKKLIEQLDCDDLTTVKDIAHQIKTSAKAVGSKKLAELFSELEATSEQDSIANIEHSIDSCLQTFSHAENEIASILKYNKTIL
ncbi:ATP-binding protein [Pseudoalteromonas phenolica]|uniref:ATP-binding protein n=1 Tax=Pseudoalteromonas phenolica TaxID=161398 RepID=UPI00110B0E52|nr:ATP-binding protein [Pseudoalteromonas phenolica]TMO56653.1 histidine kinase [Pseudoalteromonas phenolica]